MGMSRDNLHGLILAVSSSIFIGSSFIVKKKGLKKAADNGTRAGLGGYSYLYQPWWWAGMITMILGEIANFAAYAFAPAILVTPLGALSIIFSAVLAHFILQEKLHIFGVLGCVLCVVGSSTIVLHAPQERSIESVRQVWQLATEPGFLVYSALVVIAVSVLIFYCVPRYGQTHMIVYVGICSLMGSLTALDTFNTAVISPVYYVMFTSFTILASMIMFKDWDSQNASQIATELCGFVTILSGTFLLHRTKDMGDKPEEEEAPVFPNTSNRTPETNV
ncbi:Probable magnesium transporter NIPA4 [Linum perenne]